MATLTSQQLKDSYQSLVTIGDSITSDPTVGALENGKGTPLTGVGVGTNSPSGLGNALIEVFNGTDTQLTLRNSNNFGTIFNGNTIGDPTSIFSNTGFKFAIADDKNATNFSEKMRIKSSGDISFRDGSANEAFYWDASAGSLGIGTTSPGVKLDVKESAPGSTFSALRLWNNTTDTANTKTVFEMPVFNGANGFSITSFGSSADSYNAFISTGQSSASLIFGSGSSTERMRIDSSGNVSITTGNLILDSGAGIDFSDTPNSSGTMTSELLDDYEEGTWTPTISSGYTSPTYNNTAGSYTKIGNVVNFTLRLQLTGGTADANQIKISGLPFTSASDAIGSNAFIGFCNGTNYDGTQTLFIPNNDTTIDFYEADGTLFSGTEMGSNNWTLHASGFYLT